MLVLLCYVSLDLVNPVEPMILIILSMFLLLSFLFLSIFLEETKLQLLKSYLQYIIACIYQLIIMRSEKNSNNTLYKSKWNSTDFVNKIGLIGGGKESDQIVITELDIIESG